MNLYILENVLFDGSDEDLLALSKELSGFDAEYCYSDHSRSFSIRLGAETARYIKLASPPNCVALFGPAHKF